MIPHSAFPTNGGRSGLLLAAALLGAAQLCAQSTFLGTRQGQQWGTAANWSPAAVPNAVNAVAILASNGGLGNIAVTNSGLGYVVGQVPPVTLTGGLGSGAVAEAVLSNRVAVFTVTDGGSGYTSAPEVQITGGNPTVPATAIASIDPTTGKVISVTTTYGGYGYQSAPTVALSGGGGTGAEATAHVATGVVTVQLTNVGVYSSAPSVTIGPGTASGVAVLSGSGVASVTITNPGFQHVVPPTVTFSAPPAGGTRAQGTAVLTNGTVSSVIVTTSGSGYTTAPAVSFTNYVAGTTAIGSTTLNAGAVDTVVISNAGDGYVVPPVVSFGSPPSGGTRAQGYAVLSGDEISGVVLTHPGSGYVVPPTVSFGPPAVTATATATLSPLPYLDSVGGPYPYKFGTLNMTFNGSASAGRVETPDDRLWMEQSGGVQATATATVDDGVITEVSVTNIGNGYEVAPIVYATGGGGGRGARLAATVNEGKITSILVLSGGGGYTSAPTIVIQPPDSPVLNVSSSSGTLFFYGSLEGEQGFTKAGSGALTFRFNPHNNLFTGKVYLAQGVLGLQADGSLGAPENDLVLGDLTRLVAQPSVANAPLTLNSERAITIAGGGAQFSALSAYPGFFTVAGPINGPGGVVKVDSGVLVLAGDNTYTGETNVNAGIFIAATEDSLPGYREALDSSNILPERISIAAGATLAVRMGTPTGWSSGQFDALLDNFDTRVHPDAFIGVDTTGAIGVPSVDGLIAPTVLAPTWGFSKLGAGMLDLTGPNAYAGNTRIYQGTLRLAGGTLPLNNTVQFMGPGATLDLGGSFRQIGTLIEFSGGLSTVTNGDLTVALPGWVLGGNNLTTVDFSGLDSLTYTPPTGDFRLETVNNAVRTNNTVLFSAGENILTVPSESSFILGGGTAVGNGPHMVTALFGMENTVRTEHLQIGLLNSGGTIAFQPGLTDPVFNLRSTSGGSSRASVTVGETTSNIRSGNGLLNLTGGIVDARVSTLTVGRATFETAQTTDSGPPVSGVVAVEAGTLDGTSLVLGEKLNRGKPFVEAVFLQYGGDVEFGTITFGRSLPGTTTGGAALFESTYLLAGGTLSATELEVGVGAFDDQSARTLVLAGGTLTSKGPTSSLLVDGRTSANGELEVALETGTVSTILAPLDQMVTLGAETLLTAPDTSAVLVKAGEGSLHLLGTTTGFDGTLQHTLGTITLGATATIATVNAGAFVWDAGTIQVDLSTTDTTSDKLVLGGALTKGGIGPRVFDLKGVGAPGTYTLATYASTDLLPADLSAINIPGSYYATFVVQASQLDLILSTTPPLSLIEQWRLSKFGNSANSGNGADDADPDFDGRTNLLEYATGTDPLLAQAPGVTLDLSAGALRLSFNRIADPSLVYRVVATGSLANAWSAGTEIFTSTGASNVAGLVQVVDTVPATTIRFLRLEVTY